MYGVADGLASNEEIWASDAVVEWNSNTREEGDNRPFHFLGVMQCFCENQLAQDPKNIDKEFYALDTNNQRDSESGTKIC
jgi:hypothetical protein